MQIFLDVSHWGGRSFFGRRCLVTGPRHGPRGCSCQHGKKPCEPDVQVKTARKLVSHLFNFVHFGCESIVFVLTYLADFDKKHRASSKLSRSHCVYTAWWVGLSDDWDRDSVDKSNNEFGWKQHRCPRKTWRGLKYRVKVWTYRNPSTVFIERSWTTNHHWGSWGFSPTFVPDHVPVPISAIHQDSMLSTSSLSSSSWES